MNSTVLHVSDVLPHLLQREQHSNHSLHARGNANIITAVFEPFEISEITEGELKKWCARTFPPAIRYLTVLSFEQDYVWKSACFVTLEEYESWAPLNRQNRTPAFLFPCVTIHEAKFCLWAILAHLINANSLYSPRVACFSICLTCTFPEWKPESEMDHVNCVHVSQSKGHVNRVHVSQSKLFYQRVYLPSAWVIGKGIPSSYCVESNR